MSNDVFANGREVSCKAGSGKSICDFPDVCMTPPQTPATPPGAPIPYPNTGVAGDTTSGSKKVMISNKEIILKNKSYFKSSTGDEAGSAPMKGVVTHKTKGKVYFNAWSMDVKVEGENVVRHLDLTTHNHGSGTNTAPWPFIDSMNPSQLKNHPCKDEIKKVDKSCDKKKPDKDMSAACCSARKCMMLPGKLSGNKCCKRSGKKMTPHHAIPVMDHYSQTGARKISDRTARRKLLNKGQKRYDEDKAPAICASGKDHGVTERPGRLKQHGRIGRAFGKG